MKNTGDVEGMIRKLCRVIRAGYGDGGQNGGKNCGADCYTKSEIVWMRTAKKGWLRVTL